MAFFSNIFKWRSKNETPVNKEISDIVNRGVSPSVLNNPNYNRFSKFDSISKIVSKRSVIDNNMEDYVPGSSSNESYFEMLGNYDAVIPLESNKATRIEQYRRISALPECDWCLEEIADDFLHEDEDGKFITLNVKMSDDELNQNRRNILNSEFERYVNYFDLENNGFELMKRLLIEGELAWENVINPEKPELGIIGIRQIPAEFYETLLDKKTGARIGIYIDKKKYADTIKRLVTQSYYASRQVFDMSMGMTGRFSFDSENCVSLLWPQITYVNSGQFTHDGLVCLPVIEKAKQAYYQYTLLKDSAVILRVTRAPERLLFNVDTANLPVKVADERVKNFSLRLKQRKVMNSSALADSANPGKNPNMTNVYDPVSMLEAYIFGKSNSSEGTTVENIGSSAQYDQIDDIKFFLKILLKQFKIPWSRLEAPESINEQSDSLSYEEYTFSRMVIRLQRRFALGLKRGFITHLKLRGLFEKYALTEACLDINFTKPVLYDLTQAQKLQELKMAAYNGATEHDEFSKIWAMKKILKMTDEEIKENFINVMKEKVWLAAAEYYAGKVDKEHTVQSVLDEIEEYGNPVDATLGSVANDKEKADANEGGGENEGGNEGGSDLGETPPEESSGGGEEGGELPFPV